MRERESGPEAAGWRELHREDTGDKTSEYIMREREGGGGGGGGWRDGGMEGGRERERDVQRAVHVATTHPLFINERVDLCDGDNLSHETAEPLRVQEEQLAQLALHVWIVE